MIALRPSGTGSFELLIQAPALILQIVQKYIRHGSACPSIKLAQSGHHVVKVQRPIDVGRLS